MTFGEILIVLEVLLVGDSLGIIGSSRTTSYDGGFVVVIEFNFD